MITETKIQKDAIVYHKFCDVCGKEIIIGLACSKAKCMYCKKDLCEECIGHEDSTMGDYHDVFCKGVLVFRGTVQTNYIGTSHKD